PLVPGMLLLSPPEAMHPPAWNVLLSRRDLLRVSSLAVAGSVLPGVRAATPAKAKSVLLLWMAGGVTHIDSFDPKPDAPSEVPGGSRLGPPPPNLFTGGWLGREYAPFCTGGQPRNEDFTARVHEAAEEQFNQQAVTPALGLDAPRLAGRKSLRERLDGELQLM